MVNFFQDKSRAGIRAALTGILDKVEYQTLQPFGLQIPMACPGIPAELLNPRKVWERLIDYDATAGRLARAFRENYQTYENSVGSSLLEPLFT